MSRPDKGAYSEDFRPDEDDKSGIHNLPWAQKVNTVITDVTNWDVFDEEGSSKLYGSKGGGDLTGVGFNEYPGGHNEQYDGGSGACPE